MVETTGNNSTFHIGKNSQFSSISDMLNHIPGSASNLTIIIETDIIQPENIDLGIIQPELHSVTFSSSNSTQHCIDFQNASFFAAGVKVLINEFVTLKNCFLYAGCCAENGNYKTKHYGEIIINGMADYVFCGGYASGVGSVSSINNTKAIINGNANFVFGGGFAVSGGEVRVNDSTEIVLSPTGKIENNTYNGSYLIGKSKSIINKAKIVSEGHINGSLFPDSLATDKEGSSEIQSSELTIKGSIFDGNIRESKNTNNNRINSLTINISDKEKFKVEPSLHAFIPHNETITHEAPPPPPPITEPTSKRKLIITICLLLLAIMLGWKYISNNKSKKNVQFIPTLTKETSRQYLTATNSWFVQEYPVATSTPKQTATSKRTSTPKRTATPVANDGIATIYPSNTPILLIEPVGRTSTPTSIIISSDTPTPTELAPIIGIVQVGGEQIGTVFYTSPDIKSDVRRTIRNNEEVEIISGPSIQNGISWYKVKDSLGYDGWVFASSLQLKQEN